MGFFKAFWDNRQLLACEQRCQACLVLPNAVKSVLLAGRTGVGNVPSVRFGLRVGADESLKVSYHYPVGGLA
jgi:hypothetical protein